MSRNKESKFGWLTADRVIASTGLGFTFALTLIAYVQLGAIRNSLETAERAWVTVTGVGFVVEPEVDALVSARVRLMNSGSSPALDLQIHNSIALVEGPLPQSAVLGDVDAQPSRGVLAPSSPVVGIVTRDEPLSGEQLDQLANGKLRFYVYGLIRYTDIFEQQHHTTYCFVFAEGRGFNACPQWNSAT